MSAALLKKMRDMGLTLEQAIELMETWEDGAAKPVPELSKGALRTRKWREKQVAASPGDVTETPHSDVSPTRTYAQVVTPFSSSLRSEEVGGGGGGEREHERASDDWPAGKARDHAKLLVEIVASPRLDPSKSPGLVTTMGRLEAWRRDGASWEHDVIPVVTALCAKQRGPVSTWKFFDQPIARSIADNRAALAIPEADPKPRGQGPPRSFGEQIAAEHAEARRRVLES